MTITIAKLKEQVLGDRSLTQGQKEQVMNFLAYPPGKGRGARASDPIYKASGLEVALNYLNYIGQNREEESATLGVPLVPISRYQVIEVLAAPKTLDEIARYFPKCSRHGIKSCVNKAVADRHLKYNLKTRLYYI
jgi:HSP90 family molecular chaperone